MSPRASKKLIQLFEEELRAYDADMRRAAEPRRKRRVSGELDQQVVEFALEMSSSGSTPEQMLVELKSLLATVAPEVPGAQRNALVATVTGRAIDAFFKNP